MDSEYVALAKAAAWHFRRDHTAPGVLVAWINRRGEWYVAVQRFEGKYPKLKRHNIIVGYHSDPVKAIRLAASAFNDWVRRGMPESKPIVFEDRLYDRPGDDEGSEHVADVAVSTTEEAEDD